MSAICGLPSRPDLLSLAKPNNRLAQPGFWPPLLLVLLMAFSAHGQQITQPESKADSLQLCRHSLQKPQSTICACSQQTKCNGITSDL
jgi:hypothetical protein